MCVRKYVCVCANGPAEKTVWPTRLENQVGFIKQQIKAEIVLSYGHVHTHAHMHARVRPECGRAKCAHMYHDVRVNAF